MSENFTLKLPTSTIFVINITSTKNCFKDFSIFIIRYDATTSYVGSLFSLPKKESKKSILISLPIISFNLRFILEFSKKY